MNEVVSIVFYLLASVMVSSGMVLLLTKNSIYASLCLLAILLSTAGLFLLIGAEFIALSLLVVYVGGVLVLLLFFIFYMGNTVGGYGRVNPFRRKYPSFVMMLLWFLVLAYYIIRIVQEKTIRLASFSDTSVDESTQSNIKLLGAEVFSKYIFEFEFIGVMLLVLLVFVAYITSSSSFKEKETWK
jgi:NADH:ubiquinone oxidoreductase subunit 6 (subunit J)